MRKVLLVEDEKLIREGIKASLDWPGLGLEIVGEAADGDEGLEMALTLKPDIIINRCADAWHGGHRNGKEHTGTAGECANYCNQWI